MKQAFIFLVIFIFPVLLFAQQTDTTAVQKDSLPASDTVTVYKRDLNHLQKRDSQIAKIDSIRIVKKDSALILKEIAINQSAHYILKMKKILEQNIFLNFKGKPVALTNQFRKSYSTDNFFYLLAALGMLIGFFRFFYTRYFNNLFRVFFNASLRQSQLTDQLLQAKLPSLLFNILFIFAGGLYIYLLLRYYNWISIADFWPVLLYCTLSLALIYLIKFITLKFTGWLTGHKEITNVYVFIIFLINKILGILLLPFAVIIAFSMPGLTTIAVIISLLLTGLMFLLRFFRSYGLLQHKLKISRLHFFMYVAGIEILPVLLIYKGLVLLLSKNM